MGNIPFKSLETILNSIPSGIIITDTKGRFLYLNSRGMDLFGFSYEDFNLDAEFEKMKALKPDGSPFPPEEMPITNSVKYGKAVRNVEMRIQRCDGMQLSAVVSSAPLYDAHGTVISAIVVLEDITERIQAETALKESQDRYRVLVETNANSIIVHQNGRFLFANPAALQLLGVKTFEEFQSRTIYDFMVQSHLPKITKKIERVKAGQKSAPNREEEVVTLDGRHVPVDIVGAPIRYDGKDAVLVILRNITSQVELTNKLQEYTSHLEQLVEDRTKEIVANEKRYHEIYDSFGEALIATDWELNVIHWNKAAERVTTIKGVDAVGRKVYDVLPEMVTVDITPYFEALKDRKPARFMMNTVSRETKKPSTFEISTYPSSQGIIIIVEDKTEEEQNKRLSAIGATAGMVGHDIRNPLQAIEGDVYLLKDYLTSMPQSQTKNDVQESLDSIDKNIGYIDKIVADLQDYARQLKPEIAEVSLLDLVSSVIENTEFPSNVEKKVIIESSFELRTDPTLVRRAVTNLITNAIQAMPKGGKLSVAATKAGNEAVITVSDTGVGIPPEVKPKLFTPMMTTKAKGQGLGLAVVKRLIEALKGTITLESELGKGTTFTIKLPLNP